jgi:hypothetical protein
LNDLFEPLGTDPEHAEPITRFIFARSQYSAESGRVKPRALEPSPADNATSVFRTLGLDEISPWALARLYVEQGRERAALARADLTVSAVDRFGLSLVAVEPPPRHANIVGWPEEKSARMSVAQQLAATARLVLRPVT